MNGGQQDTVPVVAMFVLTDLVEARFRLARAAGLVDAQP